MPESASPVTTRIRSRVTSPLSRSTASSALEAVPESGRNCFGCRGVLRGQKRLPEPPADDLGLPEAMLLRPSLFAVFDNVRDELTLAVPVRPQAGGAAEAAWSRGQALLAQARAAAGCSEAEPTSADGAWTVEPVFCLGLCAVSPAAELDRRPLGRLTADGLAEALR